MVRKSEKTQKANQFIKKEALNEEGGGIFFELEPDFEKEFSITEMQVKQVKQVRQLNAENKEDNEDDYYHKQYKPYYAYKKYFDDIGVPNVEELDKLKKHKKLNLIFKAIYNKKIE